MSAFCVILFGSLGACGGEEEVTQTGGLSLEEYVANVEALREQSRRLIDELTGEVPPFDPNDEDRVLTFYRRLLTAMRDGTAEFFSGMRALDPPAEIETEHQVLIETSGEYQAGLDALVRHVQEASSMEDMDRFIPNNEGASALGTACSELQEAIVNHGFELDFNCEYARGPGGLCFLATPEEGYCDTSGVVGEPDCETTAYDIVCGGCIAGVDPPATIAPDFQSSLDCEGIAGEDGTGDFGGIHANADAPMPPLPPDLVAVSDYLEFESAEEGAPDVSGFVIPLTEEITDFSTIAFYTYDQAEWRRVADVTTIRDGRAEGEFTSFPANIAVLKRVP